MGSIGYALCSAVEYSVMQDGHEISPIFRKEGLGMETQLAHICLLYVQRRYLILFRAMKSRGRFMGAGLLIRRQLSLTFFSQMIATSFVGLLRRRALWSSGSLGSMRKHQVRLSISKSLQLFLVLIQRILIELRCAMFWGFKNRH